MKIIDNVLKKTNFDSLGIGATFKYNDDYYLKTVTITVGVGTAYNAVLLDSGKMFHFGPDTMVIPFNCELILL